MTDDAKIIRNIEYVQRFEFRDFIESLVMQDFHRTMWMEGFYFGLGHHNLETHHVKTEDFDGVIVFKDYDGLPYAKGVYHPYLTVETAGGELKIEPRDSVNPRSTDPYSIKVERIEAWDWGELRNTILNAIKEVEKKHEEANK